MTLFTNITRTLLQLLFLSLVISFALGINYLLAWTGPTGTAPNNNAAAPINVGTTPQVKLESLSVGKSAPTATDYGLISYGKIRSTIGGVEFPDGTVQATAASGGTILDAGIINAFNPLVGTSKTIPATWKLITFTGGTLSSSGYMGSISGEVVRLGGLVKYIVETYGQSVNQTLVTGTEVCMTERAGVSTCALLNADGSVRLRLTPYVLLNYIVY